MGGCGRVSERTNERTKEKVKRERPRPVRRTNRKTHLADFALVVLLQLARVVGAHLLLRPNLLLEPDGRVVVGLGARSLLGPVLLLDGAELLCPLCKKDGLVDRGVFAAIFLFLNLPQPLRAHEAIQLLGVERARVVAAVAPQRVELVLNHLLAGRLARIAQRIRPLHNVLFALLHALRLRHDLRAPKLHLRVEQVGQLSSPVVERARQRLLLASQRVLPQTALNLGSRRNLERRALSNLLAVLQLQLHQRLLLLHLLASLHRKLHLPAVHKRRARHDVSSLSQRLCSPCASKSGYTTKTRLFQR